MSFSHNDALSFLIDNDAHKVPQRCEAELLLQIVSLWESLPNLMTRYINFCQTGYPLDRKVVISVSDVERRIPIQYVANPQELDIRITTMAKGVPIKLSQFHGRVLAKDFVFKSFGLRLMCFESGSEGRCHSIVELGRSKDYPSGKKSFATIEVTRFTLPKLFSSLEKQISFELECRGIPSRDFMQSSNLCYRIAFHRQDLWKVSHGVWPNCVNMNRLKIEFPENAQNVLRAEIDITQLTTKLYAEVSKISEPLTVVDSQTPPTSDDYTNLWDYAKRTWASGTDRFKVCESISNGPGDYGKCVEDLVSNVDRTTQTRRFHAVIGPMNQQIGSELGLEVYRKGQQVLVCKVGERSTSKQKLKETTTNKKTGVKRKT
jgi:hypothetical protein